MIKSMPDGFRVIEAPAAERGVITFRLYPVRRSSLYCLVQVWPDLRSLRGHWAEMGHRRSPGLRGWCTQMDIYAYERGRAGRKMPQFAVINVYRGKLTMEVVTHEVGHATMAWARRTRFDFSALSAEGGMPIEEKIIYAHSTMCAEFVHKATKLGLYDDANSSKAS